MRYDVDIGLMQYEEEKKTNRSRFITTISTVISCITQLTLVMTHDTL